MCMLSIVNSSYECFKHITFATRLAHRHLADLDRLFEHVLACVTILRVWERLDMLSMIPHECEKSLTYAFGPFEMDHLCDYWCAHVCR